MTHPVKSIRYLLLFSCLATGLWAQFHQPVFSLIDKSRGMESNGAMDMVIDKDYKYWIISYNGLIEYDGSKFKTYHMPFSQNGVLGSDVMHNLRFENDSILWITYIFGAARFNILTKQFDLVPIKAPHSADILSFRRTFFDRSGHLFFISPNIGTLTYNRSANCLELYKPLTFKEQNFLLAMEEAGPGYLLYTQDGLKLFDTIKKKVLTGSEIPAPYRWTTREELQGRVLSMCESGSWRFISLFKKGSTTSTVYRLNSVTGALAEISTTYNNGRMLFKDSFGRIWLYKFKGPVEVYDPKADQVYLLPDKSKNPGDIDFSSCYTIFEDKEQNIWLCTNNGLFTYNLFQNSYEVVSKSLPPTVFYDIVPAGPDKIWISSAKNGLYEYNIHTQGFYNYAPGPQASLLARDAQLYPQSDNKFIWVSYFGGFLRRYDPASKKFEVMDDSLFAGSDLVLAESDLGKLYVVTGEGKVIGYDRFKNTFRLLRDLNKLPGLKVKLTVNAVLGVGSNELLIGTSESGLLKINVLTGRYKIIDLNIADTTSLRSNLVTTLKKTDPDHIYGGTLNGMFRYTLSNDKIENLTGRNFNQGFIHQLVNYKDDGLIVVSVNGLYLYSLRTKSIIDLGKRSNLNKGPLAKVCYSPQNDKVYVAAIESLYELALNDRNYKPQFKPIIYSITSFDKLVTVRNGNKVYLDKNHNSFQVNFGASTYHQKEELDYYYKLDDGDWMSVDYREVAFSKLSGGEHSFSIRIVYKGDRSITAQTGINIFIQKAFTETGWFYALILLLALALFYTVYKIRLNRLLAVEKIRFQLSRDLHDDMGSTLSNINILSAMAAKTLQQQPAQAEEYLKKIAANSQQTMDSMDDIVWSINPGNDHMEQLIYRMRQFASEILEPKNSDFVLKASESASHLKLKMSFRRDLFLLFKEAINNAAKYSGCNKVEVEISTKSGLLILTIQDNGKGFDTEAPHDGNGLSNMKNRAQGLGASYTLQSGKEGTRIELKLNLNKL